MRASPIVLVLVALALLAGVALPPRGAAQGGQQGSPGRADQRTTIVLAEVARREALTPPRAHPAPPEPGALPLALPLPTGAEAHASAVVGRQGAATDEPSPAPRASFAAIGDDGTAIPPDTQGAVGPEHVMTTLNSQVRVQDRAGRVLLTLSLAGFWASLGEPSPFDPKLAFDPYTGRWLFSATANARRADSALLVAVSASADPLAGWHLYRVDADADDLLWADYPSLGFNRFWAGVQVNLFDSQKRLGRADLYLFDKADLMAGGAGRFTRFTFAEGGGTQVPAVTYDSYEQTLYLLQQWHGNAGGKGFLRLYAVTGPVGEASLHAVAFPGVEAPWAAEPPNGADFAPQRGSTRRLATNDARVQSVVFRNGSLWAAQTIFLPAEAPTRSAVQWWEISPEGSVRQVGRIDDAAGAIFYAFPSLAVNQHGDALLGFAHFTASDFASGAYALRHADDPPGTMRAPRLLKAGEAPYVKTGGGTRNRWGDYSSTVVDPRNDTDFWTVQEYAQAPCAGSGPTLTDCWGTWWGQVAPPGRATPTPTPSSTATPPPGASPTPSATATPTRHRRYLPLLLRNEAEAAGRGHEGASRR